MCAEESGFLRAPGKCSPNFRYASASGGPYWTIVVIQDTDSSLVAVPPEAAVDKLASVLREAHLLYEEL